MHGVLIRNGQIDGGADPRREGVVSDAFVARRLRFPPLRYAGHSLCAKLIGESSAIRRARRGLRKRAHYRFHQLAPARIRAQASSALAIPPPPIKGLRRHSQRRTSVMRPRELLERCPKPPACRQGATEERPRDGLCWRR